MLSLNVIKVDLMIVKFVILWLHVLRVAKLKNIKSHTEIYPYNFINTESNTITQA